MEKYTTPVKKDNGGSPINVWFKAAYLNNESWTNDEEIQVIDCKGNAKKIPRKDVAILFRDLAIERLGNTDITSYYGNVGGNAVNATYVALVSGTETYVSAFSSDINEKHEHILTRGRKQWIPWVVQPVPLLISNEEQNVRTQTVWQQNARTWVSGGHVDIDMNDHHVANMLVCQQASLLTNNYKTLLMQYVKKKMFDQKKIEELFYPLLLHLESTQSYLNIFDRTKKPIEALCYADFSTDVLHREIAGYLTNFTFTKLNMCRSLELLIRRIFKHHGYDINMRKESLHGVCATLTFPPLIRQLIKKEITYQEMILNLYNNLISIHEEVNKIVDTLSQKEKNKQLLFAMIKKSQLNNLISFDDLSNIYDWIYIKENYLLDVPLYDLKILTEPKLDYEYEITDLTIKGNKLLNKIQMSQDTNTNSVDLIAKSPADWSAIIFKSNGIYNFTAHIIGDAYPRRSGHDWCLMCGINFTTGREILPVKKEMFYDSGDYWVKNDSTQRVFSNKLDLNKQFQLKINDKDYYVYQNDQIYFHGTAPKKNVLVCFKNIKLTLTNYEKINDNITIKFTKKILNMFPDEYKIKLNDFYDVSQTTEIEQ
jgi:hypothetical protein